MERHPKTRSFPKFRGRMHQTHPSTLFFPIFSLAREKMGTPEARQKRPRRNESLQARLLILCARFFLSKPQTEFAVWVLSQICDNLSVSAAPSQHPYPFCPFGTFPPDRGNRYVIIRSATPQKKERQYALQSVKCSHHNKHRHRGERIALHTFYTGREKISTKTFGGRAKRK